MRLPTRPQRRLRQLGTCALAAAAAALPRAVAARPVEAGVAAPPVALILFDTSGSMEWRDDNDDFTYPTCIESGDEVSTSEGSSRMHAAIEVLTGTVQSQYCHVDTRTSNPTRIDQSDPSRPQGLRHSRLCSGTGTFADPSTECVPNDPAAAFAGLAQNNDGLLDQFGAQIAFGFMAFDSFPEESECADGMFSYGRSRSMPTTGGGLPDPPVNPEASMGCALNPSGFCWNLGARAPYVNEPGAPNCADPGFVPQGYSVPPLDPSGTLPQTTINQEVQGQITRLLPYWSTPIEAILDDAYTFLLEPAEYFAYKGIAEGRDATRGLEDPYAECRKRFVVLVTDGVPSFGDCVRTGDTPSTDPWDVGCENFPYADAPYYARRLYEAGVPVHVVGFNIPSASATILDDVAAAGGTTSARFANSGLALVFELGDILSQIASGTPSRTAPANATRLSSSPNGVGEFSFQANFTIHEGSPYWTGDVKRIARFCDDGALADPVEVSTAEWLDARTRAALDNLPILTTSPSIHSCYYETLGLAEQSLFPTPSVNPLVEAYGVTSAEIAAACQVGALPGALAPCTRRAATSAMARSACARRTRPARSPPIAASPRSRPRSPAPTSRTSARRTNPKPRCSCAGCAVTRSPTCATSTATSPRSTGCCPRRSSGTSTARTRTTASRAWDPSNAPARSS